MSHRSRGIVARLGSAKLLMAFCDADVHGLRRPGRRGGAYLQLLLFARNCSVRGPQRAALAVREAGQTTVNMVRCSWLAWLMRGRWYSTAISIEMRIGDNRGGLQWWENEMLRDATETA